MAVADEHDRKTEHYYPFVGVIHDDNTVRAISHPARGFELCIHGNVYPAKHRRASKIAISEVWYALVSAGRHNSRAWLVRSDKLHNVQKIEALRWRALLGAQAQVELFDTTCERARAIGRIWCKDSIHRTDRSFLVWPDKHRQKSNRFSPEELLGDRTNAVDRLANLATPEEEAIGADYDEALVRLARCRARVAMIDEILDAALRVRGVKKARYEPQLECQVAERYRITINGRIYYQISDERAYSHETRRIWPLPNDNLAKF